jgi:hypothetical protein
MHGGRVAIFGYDKASGGAWRLCGVKADTRRGERRGKGSGGALIVRGLSDSHGVGGGGDARSGSYLRRA